MKGDFSRLTFDKNKHYTSVRMQQGRLQLDSDSNEQVDIQAHLYRTQVVDLIGAESGVPSSENDTGEPYRDSFKISVAPDGDDLAIAPGHLYVNGTLCELEATEIDFEIAPSPTQQIIKVKTLIVDGRKFAKNQWVEILPANKQFLQIEQEIDTQTLQLSLSGKVENPGQLRRIVTYKTQPDYPNPEHYKNGLHFVYVDVWERHISTVEDPELREVALNIPDTTTRTKTVWQLQLQPLNRQLIQDLTADEPDENKLLDKLKQLSIKELDQAFNTFWNSVQVDTKPDIWQQNFFPERSLQKFHELIQNITRSHQEELQSYFQNIATIENTKKTLQTDFDEFLKPSTLEPTAKTEKVNNFNQELEKITTPDQKQVQELLGKITIPEQDKLLENITELDKKKQEISDDFNNLLEQIVVPKQQPSQEKFNNLLENIPKTDTNKKQNLIEKIGNILEIAKTLEQNKQSLRDTFNQLLANLIASKPSLKKIVAYEKDEVNPENLNDSEWKDLIQEVWQEFLQRKKGRQASMNACAKLCASSNSATSNGRGYQRLENQLYRVEIHDLGQVEKAKFKWSRDNGSIVSAIENSKNIKDGFITIRKSAQDAWANSKTGQWIEILDEERELKGLPGALAPLKRVLDTKIEFDFSRKEGEIPEQPTKVRCWDHTTKEASILTRTEWVELEAGIKVKFDDKSEYTTGNYWLIPARTATNDIEWPDDQAEPRDKRQPLSQPTLGINHDYCLLATVQIDDGKFIPMGDKNDPQSLKDERFIFPPLVRAFDRAGGKIEGDLTVLGKVGIGVETAIARLQTQATGFVKAEGKSITKIEDTTVTVNDATGLHQGDWLRVDNQQVIITEVQNTTLTIEPKLPNFPSNTGETKEFEYQQPIARFTDDQGKDKLIILANGNTGIGTSTPQNELEVKGVIKTEELITNKLNIPGELAAGIFRGATFQIAKNPTSTTPENYASLEIQDNPKRVEFVANQANVFTFTNNQVGIGASNLTCKFGVLGNVAIGDNNYLQSNTIPAEGLIVKGSVGIGIPTSKNKLDVLGGVAIGNFAGQQESPSNGLIVSGKVGIGVGTFISVPDAQLYVKGGVLRISRDVGLTEQYVQIGRKSDVGEQACDFETNCSEYKFDKAIAAPAFIGDGSGLTGVVRTTADNTFTGDLTVTQNVLLATENTRKVGIGIADSQNVQATLHVAGSIKVDDKIKCDRLIIGNDPPQNNLLNDAKFYLDGNLYVEGQLYATDIISTDTINAKNQTVKLLRSVEILGNTFKQISSRTLKEEIGNLSSQEAEQLLQTLQPVKFIYTGDKDKNLHAGFIAEDTPDLLTSTDKQAVKLLDIVAVLTKSVKDQQAKAEELAEVIKNQHNELESLQARLKELEEGDLATRQSSVLFANSLEEPVRRSLNTSRRTELSFYQRLKRLLRRFWR
ncbi:DUF6519 domain-containing protein [Nostoc sp. WHI]|uniref:DUF6519 domain-containing protein n=1 Tax=Nostoc sp. WHI TaxID=2650611 RepID=UPI0018C45456|nr:DUF6519 domain-containing protein [Nostoc sp. WHI]MBG1267331.1 hypothetical protein [Nostoc sp. WHI]